jgi:hypothetical protein
MSYQEAHDQPAEGVTNPTVASEAGRRWRARAQREDTDKTAIRLQDLGRLTGGEAVTDDGFVTSLLARWRDKEHERVPASPARNPYRLGVPAGRPDTPPFSTTRDQVVQ